jgi:hypothetical protein
LRCCLLLALLLASGALQASRRQAGCSPLTNGGGGVRGTDAYWSRGFIDGLVPNAVATAQRRTITCTTCTTYVAALPTLATPVMARHLGELLGAALVTSRCQRRQRGGLRRREAWRGCSPWLCSRPVAFACRRAAAIARMNRSAYSRRRGRVRGRWERRRLYEQWAAAGRPRATCRDKKDEAGALRRE